MVKDSIRFIGMHDFYKKCDSIKEIYVNLSKEEKQIYKYYVYSRRQLREYTCNIIWEFLNESDDSEFAKNKERLYEEVFRYRF